MVICRKHSPPCIFIESTNAEVFIIGRRRAADLSSTLSAKCWFVNKKKEKEKKKKEKTFVMGQFAGRIQRCNSVSRGLF